jgi:hypothetical protein
MTQELNVHVTKEALLRIDHEAALLQDGEDHGQVLAMSCRVGAGDQDVIQVEEGEGSSPIMESMSRWKVMLALLRPNSMRTNTNRPKGVMIAI